MEVWHIWVIASLLMIILEVFTSGFVVFCFAFGGLLAALAAGLGAGLGWQIAAFAVGSALAFFFIRPIVMKLFFRKGDTATNTDALIGRTATVSEPIDAQANTGRVKIDGDDWKAESEDGSRIEAGTKVTVVSRESIILTVRKQ